MSPAAGPASGTSLQRQSVLLARDVTGRPLLTANVWQATCDAESSCEPLSPGARRDEGSSLPSLRHEDACLPWSRAPQATDHHGASVPILARQQPLNLGPQDWEAA